MSRCVEILLSTYNGAEFLPAQLASLQAQSHADWRLLWRDDGSSDATCALMEDFIASEPRARALASAGNIGVTASFEALLAARDCACAGFAYCDQDDVWLPGKLESGLALLDQAAGPAMLCGRLQLVDAALDDIGLSPLPRRPADFGDMLVENRATGCTVLLNPAAAALMDAPWPSGVVMHDWWACLCILAAGGAVLYQAEPQILYRQHQGNVVGIAAGGLERWRRRLARFRRREGRPLTEQARALRAYTDGFITDGNRRLLDRFISGGRHLAFGMRFMRQEPLDDAVFRLMRLLGQV